MAATRVYVSFDYDYDNDLKNLLIGQARNPAERAAAVGGAAGAVLAGDVRQSVRRPEPLQPVRRAHALLRHQLGRDVRLGHTCTWSATARTISSTASSTGTPLFCSPLR